MAKILIVEDNINNLRLVKQILLDFDPDLEITIAMTGEEAQVVALDQAFDLVLMDISLPDMDGMQITRILKQYPLLQKTPFIAVTAYAMLSDEGVFRDVFDDYMSKPIDEDRFTTLIERWLV